MLDWLGAPTWHFARSILNTTPGYSNSGSMRPDFEIGGSGGIRARRRPRGDTELLPRCNEAARRTQRRYNAADLSASHLRSDRLVVGSHERLAGLEASSVHWTLWQCRESFNCVFAMQNQTQKPPCATLPTCPLASTQRPLWWLAGLRAAGWSRGVECCPGRCGNVVSVPTPCLQRAFNHDRRTARRVFNFERAIVSQQGGPCVVSAQREPTSGRVSQGAWRDLGDSGRSG